MGKTILLVEDSPTMRSLISATIAMRGAYEVVEAENGFEALRMLPKHRVDMVITDINMPDINGLELVKVIRGNDNYKNLPLIIVSTEGSEKDRQKGLSLGADAYLVKPFVPEELQQLIAKFLA
ncbi:MAG: response regulator [Desulfuromonadaceae bacterium]